MNPKSHRDLSNDKLLTVTAQRVSILLIKPLVNFSETKRAHLLDLLALSLLSRWYYAALNWSPAIRSANASNRKDTMTQTPNNLAAYIWSLADLLRGDFKQSQYGRIILPFTLLRRLECVLEDSKAAMLAQVEKVQAMNVSEEAQEKLLLRATNGLSFYNTSKMDLSKLGEAGIAPCANMTWDTYSSEIRV